MCCNQTYLATCTQNKYYPTFEFQFKFYMYMDVFNIMAHLTTFFVNI